MFSAIFAEYLKIVFGRANVLCKGETRELKSRSCCSREAVAQNFPMSISGLFLFHIILSSSELPVLSSEGLKKTYQCRIARITHQAGTPVIILTVVP